jgi:hypothetical protein
MGFSRILNMRQKKRRAALHAMAAGLIDHVWELEDLVALLD